MFNRRDFIKTTALMANMGVLKPVNVFADSTLKTTGFFGVHPFIEQHPESVFIMHTNVNIKTNGDANQREGMRFANEVIVPKDKTGFPTSRLIPIKPNITGELFELGKPSSLSETIIKMSTNSFLYKESNISVFFITSCLLTCSLIMY